MSLTILAHRAQDQYPGFYPSGVGVELDLRDFDQFVFLAHDPIVCIPDGYQHAYADNFLLESWLREDLKKVGKRPWYALNIKADGIEAEIKRVMDKMDLSDRYFVFDMSYPSLRTFEKLNVPFAWRVSDEESAHFHRTPHFWCDQWDWDGDYIALGFHGQAVHEQKNWMVSPELHNKTMGIEEIVPWWRTFIKQGCAGICTDYYKELETFIRKQFPEKVID